LGWGGWWFWDPVENASLMPWLTGTALIHSTIVMEKRDSLKAWTVLLAILTFSFSLLGTFLVRSGVLTSVHSFASDPTRGIFILAIVTTFTAGSLALFAWRASALASGSTFSIVSRESSLLFNNLLLTASCGVVLIGTLYPLALEALTGDKISVGAPFFNRTVVRLFLPLLFAVPFGIFLAWKRGNLEEAARRLTGAAVLALGAGLTAALIGGASIKAIIAITLGVWVIAASAWELLWRAKFPDAPLSETIRRLGAMRRSQLGSALGHIGMGVTVIGIAISSAWNVEHLAVMKPGDSAELAGYQITFKNVYPQDGPNYAELAGAFELRRGGKLIDTTVASKRKYDAPPTTTTEAGIAPRALGDVYVVLGSEVQPGEYAVRLYFHPFVRWIWGGALIMFLGGLLSLLDRRLRIGVPQRAVKPSAAPAPAPAE
jgi:cytochrome c-type biogenesis protein CcmF